MRFRKTICPLCIQPDAEVPLAQTMLWEQKCKAANCQAEQAYLELLCYPLGPGLQSQYCKVHTTLTIVCHVCNSLIAVLRVRRRDSKTGDLLKKPNVKAKKLATSPK